MNAENNRETISSSASMVEHAQRLGVLPAAARAGAGTGWARVRAAFVADARLLLIALWLGAAVFFSFAVAPSAFAVLPARELAGAVVSRTLAIVNTGGAVIGLLLLLSLPLDRGARSRRAVAGEAASLLILTALCAAGQWVVAARMQALRAQMGRPIDELAATDPLRVAFNSLHVYSVWALVAAMLAGAAALLLIARRTRMRERDKG
ncbi:MAG TPA: DUF4149 domain-containing protein [Pyrinomonadaceae bacterium]